MTLENHSSFFNSALTYPTQGLLLPFVRRYGDARLAVLAGLSYCFVAQKK